jgi:small subunit ribosomal protein S8
MLDPISEMLTKIRNAQKAGHREVSVRSSKIKWAIAQILRDEEFVEDAFLEKGEKTEKISMKLKYFTVSATDKKPAISEIKRISKQGRRVYVKSKEIKKVKNNYGLAIISTPGGLMSGSEARKKGLGGEYICEVW